MRYIYRNSAETQENNYSSLAIPGIIAVLLVAFLVLILAAVWQYNNALLDKINDKASASAENTAAGQRTVSSSDAANGTQSGKDELAEQKVVLKELLDLRARIINSLSEKLQASGLEYSLDMQNGTVRFSNAIFFNSNRFSIEKSGEECLEKFIPIYMSVLMDENNKKYLDEIVIEGYADDTGDYLFNLDLSQKRAYEVVRYITGSQFLQYAHKDEVLEYLSANGRSYNNPIMTNGVVEREKSRRVEFRFRLKYDEFLEKMKNALDEVNK